MSDNYDLNLGIHKMRIYQCDPSPAWVKVIIDGKDFGFHPHDFKIFANWLMSISQYVVKSEEELLK